MGNMPHCRFENTARDLRDVVENWDDPDLDADERRARERIFAMAQDIVRRGL